MRLMYEPGRESMFIPRMAFDKVVRLMMAWARAYHAARKEVTGVEIYEETEVVLEGLASILAQNKKCRIVMRYDPAGERVYFERELDAENGEPTKDLEGWHTNSWTAEKEEALKHFGYPADWASDTCRGVYYWKNKEENVFDRLAKMDVLVPHMDKTKRVRVRFEYDPIIRLRCSLWKGSTYKARLSKGSNVLYRVTAMIDLETERRFVTRMILRLPV